MSADAYSNRPNIVQGGRASRWGLRGFALFYLGALLMVPVIMIFYKAFGDGIAHAWESVTTVDGQMVDRPVLIRARRVLAAAREQHEAP